MRPTFEVYACGESEDRFEVHVRSIYGDHYRLIGDGPAKTRNEALEVLREHLSVRLDRPTQE